LTAKLSDEKDVESWKRLAQVKGLLLNYRPLETGRFEEIPLTKLSECKALLMAALPGLGDEAHKLILKRSDGNPRMLAEIIAIVEGDGWLLKKMRLLVILLEEILEN